MASYAGGDGDFVGGLVGGGSGTVTASYATGAVDGGDGDDDRVGGLVGENDGTITASYATGDVDGGDGRENAVGGLVGENDGTITASYATGDVDGVDGAGDRVGGLVGLNGGTTTASYGFGTQMGGETAGVDRSGDTSPAVVGASQLTAANSSTEMGDRWSARVWDFGTARQIPRLKWVTSFDSSGATDVLKYPCERTLLPTGQSCGGGIPGQDSSLLADGDGDNVPDNIDVDDDNDGLIEIRFLEDLDYVRHSLAGTSYKPGASATAHTIGAPAGGLKGYELARSLDFDEAISYRSGSVNTDWTGGTGWTPIGDSTGPTQPQREMNRFNAIFDGNSNTIDNLTINLNDRVNGLFGFIGGDGAVRRLNLANAWVNGDEVAGSLAGESSGSITAVSATNSMVVGGRLVGGLVGDNNSGGTITASYTMNATVTGGTGNDNVGGLVGDNSTSITTSYALNATVSGGDGFDSVGGLVGDSDSQITASYATGMVNGGGR